VGRDDDNAPGTAIELQRQILSEYAREMGYTETAAYLDNGFSGLDTRRPAFTALNADIAAGKVGVVLAKDHSRIYRDLTDICQWWERMDKLGVTVLCKDAPAYQDGTAEPFFQYRRKKRKQERHTVRTPPPAFKKH
jgi:DNA invertase Pin-like site-specific DNA recombinase